MDKKLNSGRRNDNQNKDQLNQRRNKSRSKSKNKKKRSRETSYNKDKINKENKEDPKNQKLSSFNQPTKIIINPFNDSNSIEPQTIENYYKENLDSYNNQKITLEEYIQKNDVDHEKISLLLEESLNQNKNIFYKLYEKELFKIPIEKRLYFQNKIKNFQNIPQFIRKNFIQNNSIKNIFINILTEISKITKEKANINLINNIFLTNNVYFNNEIDIKVPNKKGCLELKYYSLLSDIFFYFNNNNKNVDLLKRLRIFKALSIFINNMKNIEDNELISNSNLLINILYMYLEMETIEYEILCKIVLTCLPFDLNLANKTLKLFIGNEYIKINDETINENNSFIRNGEEIITLEDEDYKKIIKIKSKCINWYLEKDLINVFLSDVFTLCVRYPFNKYCNYFFMDENIRNSVENFFNLIISSPSMKQAMIIDHEASKYKYFFNNKDILNEFESNVHYVIFPFKSFY